MKGWPKCARILNAHVFQNKNWGPFTEEKNIRVRG